MLTPRTPDPIHRIAGSTSRSRQCLPVTVGRQCRRPTLRSQGMLQAMRRPTMVRHQDTCARATATCQYPLLMDKHLSPNPVGPKLHSTGMTRTDSLLNHHLKAGTLVIQGIQASPTTRIPGMRIQARLPLSHPSTSVTGNLSQVLLNQGSHARSRHLPHTKLTIAVPTARCRHSTTNMVDVSIVRLLTIGARN